MRFRIILFLITIIFATSCDYSQQSELTVDLKICNFGDVLSIETKELSITFTNNSSAVINVDNIGISGINLDRFEITEEPVDPVISAANGTYILKVKFTPALAGGPAIAFLNFEYTNSQNIKRKIIVHLKGNSLAARNIKLDPESLEFSKIETNDTKTETISIENHGKLDLTISNVAIVGDGFTLETGWTGTPIILSEGTDNTLEIKFAPLNTQMYSAVLQIFHDDESKTSPLEAQLSGQGITPITYSVENVERSATFSRVTGNAEILWNSVDGDFDDETEEVTLDFTFNYFGVEYTNIYVCVNGFAAFTDPTSNNSSNTILPSTDLPDNLIAVLWDNLSVNSANSDKVVYETIGNAPYRKFIVEWQSVTITASAATSYASFGLSLSEGTNIIEMYYKDDNDAGFAGLSASIGIENIDGTRGYEGTSGSPSIIANLASDIQFIPDWLPILNPTEIFLPTSVNLSEQLKVVGGSAAYEFYFLNWAPEAPTGLNFNIDGTITGTTAVSGDYTVNVTITDSGNLITNQLLTVHILDVVFVDEFAADLNNWNLASNGVENNPWNWQDGTGITNDTGSDSANGFAHVTSVGLYNGVEELMTLKNSFDCSAYSNVYLHYCYTRGLYNSGLIEAKIQISTNGGSSWVTVHDAQNQTGEKIVKDVSSVCAGKSNILIRIKYVGADDTEWKIDDIKILGN